MTKLFLIVTFTFGGKVNLPMQTWDECYDKQTIYLEMQNVSNAECKKLVK